MATPQMSYVPEPQEQPYYEALFAAADTHRAGAIAGGEAVAFLGRSRVSQETLRAIWTMSDVPASGTLDKPKFAVAVRLIQLHQNEQQGRGRNLATPPGVTLRPAFFEGISGVSIPAPGQPPAGSPASQQQQPSRAPTPQQQPPPRAPTPQQPPAPPRAPTPQNQRPSSSFALTPQDPYTLTPTDQSRYEVLFPQYATDGKVDGKSAFALFSKSNIPQPALAQIWRMVDQPVDNVLDKAEFCMAMHLIVCIQKGLPCPPGLPIALKQFASQSKAASQPQQQLQPPSTGMQPSPSLSPNTQNPPSPGAQSRQLPPPSPKAMQQAPPAGVPTPLAMQPPPTIPQLPSDGGTMPSPERGGTGMMSSGSLGGPPPLQPQTVSISDAFEGLDGSSNAGADSYMASAPPVRSEPSVEEVPSYEAPPTIPEPVVAAPTTPPAPVSATPAPTPRSTQQLASTYELGDQHEELSKLKAALQTLQAENISLKAQMGSWTEEEKQVQKELSAVTAEVASLSKELTTLRAQVLASKSKLMASTAELQSTLEKKGMLKDLVSEATATKEAIAQANDSVEKSLEAMSLQPAPLAPSAHAFQGDLFGGGPPVTTASSSTIDVLSSGPPTIGSQESLGGHEPVSVGFPTPSPPVTSVPEPAAAAPLPVEPLAPAPAPLIQGGFMASQPPPAQPVSSNSFTGGYHTKTDSMASAGFGFDVMGGTPTPLTTYNNNSQYDIGLETVLSNEEIDEMKSKSREADNVASDAEETRRQLAAQADELRRVSDEAEEKWRKFKKEKEGKKKNILGRGKKKNEKEGERLMADAKTKKDAFLQSQSQVNDATALSKQTKNEAERLRKEAEEAEVQAASVASMQSSATPNAPPPTPVASNGYDGTSAATMNPYASSGPPNPYASSPPNPYASSAPNPYSFGAPAAPPPQNNDVMGGFSGYNPSVMDDGNARVDIPTPSGDPYDNPFSS